MVLELLMRRLSLSAPTRGPWIEITFHPRTYNFFASAPTRGPWIEMLQAKSYFWRDAVGPHTGAVD